MGDSLRLDDQTGDPVLEQPPLIDRNIREGDAHAKAIVHVHNFGFAFKCATVSNDADMDQRAIRKWTERIHIAAAEADFGNARGKLSLRISLHHFGGRDELATPHSAFSCGRSGILAGSGGNRGRQIVRISWHCLHPA